MPGQSNPRLSKALKEFVKRDPFWTAHQIHAEITRNPKLYGALHGFSVTGVRNALEGRPIGQRTRAVLTQFVQHHASDLLPPEATLELCDMAKFFYAIPPKFKNSAKAIEGDYQAYAKSTTVDGYVRRGHISFTFDQDNMALLVKEQQRRPEISGHSSYELEFEGFAVQKTRLYFAMLRTTSDCSDVTPLFYTLKPGTIEQGTRRIMNLTAYGMHYEPERDLIVAPTIYLERKPRGGIVVDFVRPPDITNPAVRRALSLDAPTPARVRRVKPLVPA